MVLVVFVGAVAFFFALVVGISMLAVIFDCGGEEARCEDCRFGYARKGAIRCRFGGRFEGGKCGDFVARKSE